MRHLKMMGVAAIAVFALVAFAGATTASATRLCQTNTSPCGSLYPADTLFPADLKAGVNAVLTTSGSPVGVNPTLTCSVSSVTVTAINQGGGAGVAVTGNLAPNGLSFTSCTSANPAGCEAQGTVSGLSTAHGQIAWTSGVNGTLTLSPPTVSFSCPILGAPVTCSFGGSGTVDGTLTGAASPVVDIVNQSITSTGGFGCPTASQWNATYTVTKPLFITNS